MLVKPFTDCPKCYEPRLLKLIGMGLSPIIRGTTTPCHGGRRLGDRLGRGKNKNKKPFWRDGPVDKKILKNSDKYIKEGKVD